MRMLRLLFLFAVLAALAPAATRAQPTPVAPLCFPDVPGITDCIEPAFGAYWQTNGGLPVFGYPIGPRERYRSPDAAAPLEVQWTERNRLELHPQNPPAYRVLLGRMGAERLAQLGRTPAESPEPAPQAGCLWFAETQHNVCDQAPGLGFRSYWERNGLRLPGLSAADQSLALFGLPLTAAQPEPTANGELVLTQWFERARLEWHPANPDDYKVLLGLLGREVRPGASAAPPVAARGGRSVVGAEINRTRVGRTYSRISEAGIDWVRYSNLVWSEIEPRRGQRDPERLDLAAQELAAISNAGGTPLVVVRGAPAWARQFADKACGPLNPTALADFAAFMGEMVARFSQPPYNVKHWELGNEPDIDPDLVPGDVPYGCWGDESDPYYGGGAYAAMLAAVYPAIKAADPQAQVVLGGLLLDCDPANPPAGKTCQPATFLEGVLRAGGGAHFDIVAYHSYVYWFPQDLDWDLTWAAWRPRGGALLGKLAFVRETLAAYGQTKPVLMNEGGLLCYRADPSCGPNGFYEAQANYAVRLFARAHAADLLGFVWYTLDGPGWQEGGLLDRQQQPRPAFEALRFVNSLLADATYAGQLREGALERHSFRKAATTYTMMWTNDGSTVRLPALPDTRAVYNSRGQPQPLAAELLVGFQPLIVESRP